MSALTVLVVEDNALNRKLVVRYLESCGYRVGLAENTAEAERFIASDSAAVILMDVSLPGEDGLSLVRRLRRREGFTTPIVAVTAHAMAGDCERALEAGCDAYLSKPIDLHLLRETVQALAGGSAA